MFSYLKTLWPGLQCCVQVNDASGFYTRLVGIIERKEEKKGFKVFLCVTTSMHVYPSMWMSEDNLGPEFSHSTLTETRCDSSVALELLILPSLFPICTEVLH